MSGPPDSVPSVVSCIRRKTATIPTLTPARDAWPARFTQPGTIGVEVAAAIEPFGRNVP